MSKELDVRGEICPFPMMLAVKALKKLKVGEDKLIVITDHAPALETIPTQAARLGFDSSIEDVGSPEWHITLSRQ